MPHKRNYKKEYKDFHGKTTEKKKRASRNAARRKMVKAGRAKKGDGMDVHHKDGNPKNNSHKNLKIITPRRNRSLK